jgi:hypothetical protein
MQLSRYSNDILVEQEVFWKHVNTLFPQIKKSDIVEHFTNIDATLNSGYELNSHSKTK